MTSRTEDTPAAVPLAQQAEGVEGGKWFRLIDKVFSERNLFAAFQQVARNDGAPGVDHVRVEEFGQQIPENIWQLSDSLKTDTFALRRYVAFTSQNPAQMRLGRSVFRRYAIESSRRRLST